MFKLIKLFILIVLCARNKYIKNAKLKNFFHRRFVFTKFSNKN